MNVIPNKDVAQTPKDYTNYKSMEYAEFVMTSSLQVMYDTTDYSIFLDLMSKYTAYDCGRLYMFVNTPVFQDAINSKKPLSVNKLQCMEKIPLAHTSLGLNKYIGVLRQYGTDLCKALPYRLTQPLTLKLSSHDNLVIENTSIVRTSALISMYSIVLSNYKLLNKIDTPDLSLAKSLIFEKVDQLLIARADVFDLGSDFYYFYDRFVWTIAGGKVLIKMKTISLLSAELGKKQIDLERYLFDIVLDDINQSMFYENVDALQLEIVFNNFKFDDVLQKIFTYWNWKVVFDKIKAHINSYDLDNPFPVFMSDLPVLPIQDPFLSILIADPPPVSVLKDSGFDEILFSKIKDCFSRDPSKLKLLDYSKSQYHLRIARAFESSRDVSSKRKSSLFPQDRDYYNFIFNDPDLVDLSIRTVCGDFGSITDGWFLRVLCSINQKYDNNLEIHHHLAMLKPPELLTYDFLTVNNGPQIMSDGFCPVVTDLVALDFLKPGIVSHDDNSWFVMSQYNDEDNFYVTKACELRSHLDEKIKLMIENLKLGIRQEYYYIIRLPYVSTVTTVVINNLLTMLQPTALNIYPSNNPHEEFFLLFVRVSPCFLHYKEEEKINFSGYMDQVYTRFKLAIHRRDWFFLNDNITLKLTPINNINHGRKFNFDFKTSFANIDFLSMPVRIMFAKKTLKSSFHEKAKKMKKKEERMIEYLKSCEQDSLLFS